MGGAVEVNQVGGIAPHGLDRFAGFSDVLKHGVPVRVLDLGEYLREWPTEQLRVFDRQAIEDELVAVADVQLAVQNQ